MTRWFSARHVVFLVAGLLCLAAGCQTAPGGSSTAPARGESAQPGTVQPKVNRLNFGIAPPLLETNKVYITAVLNYWPLAPMYEFLIGVTPEGKELVPQLATEWNLEPDGKSYHFKLKRDVPFHYGFGNVAAKDVRFVWEDMVGEKEQLVGQLFGLANQIQDVEVVKDDEAVFRLPRPDAGFLSAISQAENIYAIRSKADYESRSRRAEMGDKPYAGTAPYQFLERQQGQYIRYGRAFPSHWRQTPDFPEFEFRFMKEPSTNLAALLAGEIHVSALPPELTDQGTKQGMKAIQSKTTGLHTFMSFYGVWLNKRFRDAEVLNPDPNQQFIFPNSPLMDVRVRKALNKAIDRDALNRAFIGGKGDLIYNEFFHPSRPGWNPDWERKFRDAYGYDPEAAKKLLAEAGYGPGRPLSATVILNGSPFFPAVVDMDEAIANQWRAIGVDVKLDQSDAATFNAKQARVEYDNHAFVRATSIRQFLGATNYNGALVRTGVQLPQLTEIYDQINVTLDPKAADGLWKRWGDLAYDQYINAPLFWVPAYATVSPRIVADYTYPGSIGGTYTHVEYIKAAP